MSPKTEQLSWRERQIMDVVFRLGKATVTEVHESIDDSPSYSAVRATMGVLVEKGWLDFRKQGRQYVYRPAVSKRSIRQSALRQLIDNLFAGSTESAVAALLDMRSTKMDDEELDRLEALIQKAKKDRS